MNPVTPPGITILENMTAVNMTQQELAERMGRPLKTMNEIIKGKTAITPETALQLEHVLGIPANFWMTREARYREYLERKREEGLLNDAETWVSLFPIKEMAVRGWIMKYDQIIDQARELLNFFGIAKPILWNRILKPYASFRKSEAFKGNDPSLAAWLRKGEIESREIDCQPYDDKKFEAALKEIREKTKAEPEEFAPQIRNLCASAGVAVVFIGELSKTRASGVTRWLSPEKALIQLSSRYKTDDQFWFTFYHEAGHIMNDGKRDIFIEGNDFTGAKEESADSFAAEFLMGRTEYRALIREGDKHNWRISQAFIKDFAQKVNLAPGIVVGRLQHDQKVFFTHFNQMKRRIDWPDSIMK